MRARQSEPPSSENEQRGHESQGALGRSANPLANPPNCGYSAEQQPGDKAPEMRHVVGVTLLFLPHAQIGQQGQACTYWKDQLPPAPRSRRSETGDEIRRYQQTKCAEDGRR